MSLLSLLLLLILSLDGIRRQTFVIAEEHQAEDEGGGGTATGTKSTSVCSVSSPNDYDGGGGDEIVVCDAATSNNPAEEVMEEGITDDDSSSCNDLHESCSYWASIGECTANSNYMNSFCSKSCQKCHIVSSSSSSSSSLLNKNSNNIDQGDDNDDDLSDFGVSQVLQAPELGIKKDDLHVHIEKTRYYMKTNRKAMDLIEICQNKQTMCTIWSYIGECEKNPKYMKLNCAPVCQSCEYTTIEGRCPIPDDIEQQNVWKTNDLNRMFERITSSLSTEQEQQYSDNNLTVLSSPHTGGPWVITIDDFISESESLQLIELGSIRGYERSLGVGETKRNGESDEIIDEGRTSSTAWCMDDCYRNETAKMVMDRISKLTGIDEINAEYLQLLRYGVDQKYDNHHDYIPLDRDRQQGCRILTVYLYLNDVAAGGGTNFPSLNLTVMPKRGRALIWPSVINDDPQFSDRRMYHQALKVEAGIKYGANAWFHIRDFKTANANGCQ